MAGLVGEAVLATALHALVVSIQPMGTKRPDRPRGARAAMTVSPVTMGRRRPGNRPSAKPLVPDLRLGFPARVARGQSVEPPTSQRPSRASPLPQPHGLLPRHDLAAGVAHAWPTGTRPALALRAQLRLAAEGLGDRRARGVRQGLHHTGCCF